MTEKLMSLLDERASKVDFAPVDLGAIRREGQRRVRRRRGLAVVAASGLAAALVVGVLAAIGGSDGEDDVVVVDALPTQAVTWASGSTLHTPTDEIDLGHPINAYVRTDHGYVFTDGDGRIFSYVDGEVAEVGTIVDRLPRIVADGDGPLVGWVDPSGDRPTFVILDLQTGDIRTFDEHTEPGMGSLADEEDPAYLYAIDGRTAYWRDTRGAVAVNVDSGEAEVVDADAVNGFDLLAAEDGQLVVADSDGALQVLHGPTAQPVPGVYSSAAVFSPDARYLSMDADEPQVIATGIGPGEPIDFDVKGFATGYEWLDDATLVMIAQGSAKDRYSLLTCTVPPGTCEVVAPDFATAAELESGKVTVAVGKGA